MCNFFSAVITKDGFFYHLDMDSHEDIIEHYKLKDAHVVGGVTREANLVRLELTPQDGDICNHNISNWNLRVDQDIIPDWFDKEKAEKLIKDAVQIVFKERFAIDTQIAEIKEGIWRVVKNSKIDVLKGNAVIRVMRGSSQVGVMWGSSQVGVMRGSSQVGVMRGSSQVGEMWGSSQVGVMRGSSQVGVMRGSSQVGVMWGSSQVGVMWGSSQVGEMWGSSQVGEMWGSSQVGVMRGSSQVGEMWGSSQVGVMWGSSQVGEMWGSSQVTTYSSKTSIKNPQDKCVVISRLNGGLRIFTPFEDVEIVSDISKI
jgi:hypothetical protein